MTAERTGLVADLWVVLAALVYYGRVSGEVRCYLKVWCVNSTATLGSQQVSDTVGRREVALAVDLFAELLFKLVDVDGVEVGLWHHQHAAIPRYRKVLDLRFRLTAVPIDRVAGFDFDDQVVPDTGGDDHVRDVILGCVIDIGERTSWIRVVAVEVIGVQARVFRELRFEVVDRRLNYVVVVFVRVEDDRRAD